MPFSKPLNVPETRIVWRSGTHDDPYVDRSDVLKIINGTVILHEIPDDFNHVFIDGYSEVFKEAPLSNQFVVDYQNGYIFFNASEEGKTVTVNYKGKGVILYPAQRIYTHNDNPDIIINLQEIVDNGYEGIAALNKIDSKIVEVDTKITAIDIVQQDAITAIQEANTATNNATIKIGEMNSKIAEVETARQATIIATANADTITQDTIIAKQNADIATQNAISAAIDAQIATQSANVATDAVILAKNDTVAATSAANTAIANANTATTQANAARDVANASATNADTKATLASTAATNADTASLAANTAASNATDKANYAQNQGDYALAKGDYANEQGTYAKNQGDYAKAQGSVVEGAVRAVVHLGEYNTNVNYVKNNSVRYNGSTYICTVDCINILPTDNTHWELAAMRGLNGQGGVESVNDKSGIVVIDKNDIGLANVDNTSDINKPISILVQSALDNKVDNSRVLTDVPANAKFTDTVYTHPTSHPISLITGLQDTLDSKETPFGAQTKVNAHAGLTNNPHAVTKTQVGLGNVDNTSDASKPVSTAMQAALDEKVDNSRVLTDVPAGAIFTDTVYIHPTTAGNKHIPTGGTIGQVLKNTASGTATWQNETDTITTINGKTGAIAKADIVALGIPAQDTVYTHPANHPASMITEDTIKQFVSDAEKSNWNSKETPANAQAKADVAEINAKAYTDVHEGKQNNPHSVTKVQVGLSNVDNAKQMPIAGGTFTGQAIAQTNTAYTTAQMRNIRLYADGETIPTLANGSIALIYEV